MNPPDVQQRLSAICIQMFCPCEHTYTSK